MNWLTNTLRLATWPAFRRFERDCREPWRARDRLWRDIHGLLARAPFWTGRGAVPTDLGQYEPTDYETYRGAIEQSFAGTTSTLTGEPLLFWSESSGTSGQRKLFPITRAYQRQFQATTPPLTHGLLRRFSGFLAQPMLYFAATMPTERSPTGIEVGFISNYNYRHVAPVLARQYAFPLEVFRDAETFFRWGPLYALATDLSAMIAITPSMVEQFARRIEAQADDYWPYLEGRAQPPAPLPPLRVKAGRLALLKRALARRPVAFHELWPGLQFVCCWTGATCGMQLPRLRPSLEGVAIVEATYSATEGWMNVPLETGNAAGPLHPGAHIVEFLPAGQPPSRSALRQAWELEVGQDYEVFLTTAMGFVRYRLHDVVRCTGYFHRSPLIAFQQKSGQLLSLGQARVREAVLVEAVARAGFAPRGAWFFAPAADAGRLVLYTEHDEPGALAVAQEAHRALQAANPDYAADVQHGLLAPVGVQVLAPGHAAWAHGPRHAQTKPVILRHQAPG